MRQRGAPFFVVLMTGALAALLLTQYIRDWDIDTEIEHTLLNPRKKRVHPVRKPEFVAPVNLRAPFSAHSPIEPLHSSIDPIECEPTPTPATASPAVASTTQPEPPVANREFYAMRTLLPQVHPTVTRFLADPSDVRLGPGVTIGALTTLDTLHAGENRVTPILLEEHVTVETGCQLHGPVEVHAETIVGASSYLENVKIGRRCTIEPFSVLVNVSIPDDTVVRQGAILCAPSAEVFFENTV